jgi:hypothetical protein
VAAELKHRLGVPCRKVQDFFFLRRRLQRRHRDRRRTATRRGIDPTGLLRVARSVKRLEQDNGLVLVNTRARAARATERFRGYDRQPRKTHLGAMARIRRFRPEPPGRVERAAAGHGPSPLTGGCRRNARGCTAAAFFQFSA